MEWASRIIQKQITVNNIGKFENTSFEKEQWNVAYVIFALIIFYGASVVLYIIRYYLFILKDVPYSSLAASIAGFFTVYILNRKYPLKIFSKIDSRKILKYSLPAFFVCFIVYLPFYYNVWHDTLLATPENYNYFIELNNVEKGLFLINACILAPIAEELLSRGFFYRIIRNRYNIFWGALISTSLFYLLHGFGPFNPNIILVSLVFTYVYEKSGNIWGNIITHSLNNILWFILVFGGISMNLG